MQLDWVVDKSQNKMTLELDNVVYETFDGGQNIDKYIDGEFAYRIRQYPDKPRNWTHGNQLGNPPKADLDEWGNELGWILENFPRVGQQHLITTYRERDGVVRDKGHLRGLGVNNLTDLIAVNRLGQPASIQERWDWEEIASTSNWESIPSKMHNIDENINYATAGISWYRHKETGVIERAGSSQNCPCHVFPYIYPPVEIDPDKIDEDITNYGGKYIES